MVLKVRGVPEQGWVFYDDIEKIRVATLEWSTNDDAPSYFFEQALSGGASQAVNPDSIWVDFKPCGVEDSSSQKAQEALDGKRGWCSLAVCRMRNNVECNIAFSEGYLLNDEGKTIERL